MDFELTKSQKEIQKAAREFAKGEFDKDLALELDRKHEFPTKIWQKAAELGFIGVHYPEEYSGQDLGVVENIIIADEFCAQDSTIGSAVVLANFASECVLRFGSDELKQKFLPAVAEGKMLSSGASLPSHNNLCRLVAAIVAPRVVGQRFPKIRLDLVHPDQYLPRL